MTDPDGILLFITPERDIVVMPDNCVTIEVTEEDEDEGDIA